MKLLQWKKMPSLKMFNGWLMHLQMMIKQLLCGLVGMLSEIINKFLHKKFGTFSKSMSLLHHILLFLRQCADLQKLQRNANVTQNSNIRSCYCKNCSKDSKWRKTCFWSLVFSLRCIPYRNGIIKCFWKGNRRIWRTICLEWMWSVGKRFNIVCL